MFTKKLAMLNLILSNVVLIDQMSTLLLLYSNSLKTTFYCIANRKYIDLVVAENDKQIIKTLRHMM